MSEKRALVAMSGGVDSSVSVALAKEAGYDCKGVFMRLSCEETGFSNEKEGEAAALAAAQMQIPFEEVDLSEEFQKQVITPFVTTYEEGGTPNPCVLCNRTIKFGALLHMAEEEDAVLITGHYARVKKDQETGRTLLYRAVNKSKDQSYVLYSLLQEQLSHVFFPLGTYDKKDVRKIAEDLALSNAHRHDSQDICFVPDGDYVHFLEQYTGKDYESGDFLDTAGKKVGTHCGAVRYTIGQRKKLGLSMGHPVYVSAKDMRANTVTVGEESDLYKTGLIADHVNWIPFDQPKEPVRALAKARYRQKEQWAVVTPMDQNRMEVRFDEPQRALTVGQSVVLYDGDLVLGGGIIREILPD